MKNLYDVQQFLKRFGIIIYVGKRLYDIELMKIELQRLYDAGLMERLLNNRAVPSGLHHKDVEAQFSSIRCHRGASPHK